MNGIENLPDYASLQQVRKALRKTGKVYGAAVMVGAGFSKFADRRKDTTPEAPLWDDFKEAMLKGLSLNGNARCNPLLLAEQYRATLGDPALENLINDLVRDKERTPGKLHKRLLQLPWSNVLTTNWDTLLERTVETDLGSPFSIVNVKEDISVTRPPRIVKLHGSLPSCRPFIFTYEDFRTYETRFELFVNLAKNILTDNELCLIGFSGDDPNFLKWSGWIRDRLGRAIRPVWLIGVLDIFNSERDLLKQLSVTPIDLAPLVTNVSGEDNRHRRAMELFLEFLHQADPRAKTKRKSSSEEKYVKIKDK